MYVYSCGYTGAIGPLRTGHIKCRTGHIIIGIHSIITATYVGLGFDLRPSSEWCPKSGHYEQDTILSDRAT